MDNNKIYKDMIKVINKIAKMPRNKIEEMISFLENKPFYKFPLGNYFDLEEISIVRKIGSKEKLKGLLEFILSMKIIKESQN